VSPHWLKTLAGRLALLLALFIVVATAAVVGRESGAGEARQIEETYRTLEERAGVAADRLGLGLGERERLVSLWAQLETSQDLAVDDVDKRVSRSLEDLASTLGGGTEAIAVRPGGRLLSASDPARLSDAPPPLPAWVEPALERPAAGVTLAAEPPPGAVVATADVISNVDGGTLGRIVVWTPLARFLSTAIPLELATTALTTADGLVLARGDELTGREDEYLWARDTARTVAGPVQVAVGRPRAELTTSLQASGRQLVTLAGLFLLLAVPAALLVVGSGTAGLRRLTRAARELDARHPAPLPPVSAWAPAEVRVLGDAMESMVERLERAREDLARSESLAAVGMLTKSLAHEIRTPLSVLRAGTEMLQRAAQAGPREREVGEMLQAEVERLARLVDDLLVFGRPSPPDPRDVDLADVAGHAIAVLGGDAADNGVSVTFEGEGAPLRADPDQLRQVVVNLVTNGVRACERGGSVRVRTGLSGDAAFLEVEDDGVGIPPDRLDEIWKPLVTTHRSGSGLGLPIVRQLVEAHGGRVEVHSVPGEGTRMRVILPTEAAEQA
jgi:signal transduction histidine kinase